MYITVYWGVDTVTNGLLDKGDHNIDRWHASSWHVLSVSHINISITTSITFIITFALIIDISCGNAKLLLIVFLTFYAAKVRICVIFENSNTRRALKTLLHYTKVLLEYRNNRYHVTGGVTYFGHINY